MNYIQILEQYDARVFLLLAKSGTPVQCFAGNVYGVQQEHLTILRNEKIQFKIMETRDVHLPKSSFAA